MYHFVLCSDLGFSTVQKNVSRVWDRTSRSDPVHDDACRSCHQDLVSRVNPLSFLSLRFNRIDVCGATTENVVPDDEDRTDFASADSDIGFFVFFDHANDCCLRRIERIKIGGERLREGEGSRG